MAYRRLHHGTREQPPPRSAYAILGPVELRDGGSPIRAGGPRQLALLAFLLLHANEAVSSDRLIEAL